MANKKLRNSLKKFSGQKEEKLVTITGELGIPLGGQKIVEVPNRNGFVYVRLKSNTSEIIQAYNSEVSTIYGLPVLVARQGNIYKVIGRNLDRYRDWSDIPYLPKHGGQHSFNFSLGMGADVTWVYSQQFMPLLSYPSGTQGSMVLALEPHFYEWQGQWRYAQNTGTPSYTPYLPTITGSARMVLSYIDPSDNSIKLVAGTPFSNTMTGSAQIAPYIPDIPRNVGIPLAAVRLVTGTTAIGWGNIYDMRDFYTVSSGITGSTFGGIAVQDEGIPLGTGTTFNFVGASVDASISGSVVRVFVTGSSFNLGTAIHNAPGASLANNDEFPIWSNASADLAKATWLDIKNTNWTAVGGLIAGTAQKVIPVDADKFVLSDSAASDATKMTTWSNFKSTLKTYFDTLYSATTGSIVYQDDYVTKGSAFVFNFRTGLLASASGTNAQIDVEFGTGTYQVPYGNHTHTGSSSGEIVSYLALSNRPTSVTNTDNIFGLNARSNTSAFVGTIATLPGGATLTYNITSGDELVLDPVATTNLGKLRLYNTTRGTSALISDCTTGTNTITLTANVPAGWATTDVITVASQTVSGGGINWMDVEITGGEFLGKSNVFIYMSFADSGGAGQFMALHPFETFADAKIVAFFRTQSTQAITGQFLYKLVSNVITVGWTASGAGTALPFIREAGYLS